MEELCSLTSYGAENFEKHSNGDFISGRLEPGIVSHNVLHADTVFHPNSLQFLQLYSRGVVLQQRSPV